MINLGSRFWSKVVKTDSCWTWASSTHPQGYGRYWFNGKYEYPHRLVAGATAGQVVRHLCDNTKCVRPEHLAIGTQKENIADKQRGPKAQIGETHPRAKITNAAAAEIKFLLSQKHVAKDIANEFKVHVKTVYNIKFGSCWRHI